QPLVGSEVYQGKDRPEGQEPHDYAQTAEVHVELHHLPNPDAGALGKHQAGVTTHDVGAAGGDWLGRPQGSRDQCDGSVPEGLPVGKWVVLKLEVAHGGANENVLVQSRIDSFEVGAVVRIEPFRVGESLEDLRDPLLHRSSGPDDIADLTAV